MSDYLSLNAGQRAANKFKATSAGAADADSLITLDATGKIDASFYEAPALQLGIHQIELKAQVTIPAGSLVHMFYYTSGYAKLHLADSSTGKECHGVSDFDLGQKTGNQDVIISNAPIVQCANIPVGAKLFLGVAGALTATAPTTAGHIVQQIGWWIGGDKIRLDIQPSTVVA